jgi:hypothetical protein
VLFLWAVYLRLIGAESDGADLLISGALVLSSIAAMVPRRIYRYALMAGVMGLLAAFLAQR